MALKPASKRIRITDESVNRHGFWTLTAGVDISMYGQNPILLWNHNRPKVEGAKQDDILPIGIIQDLRLELDGGMSGLPAFDDTDEFAMRIYNKVEADIINMASAGLIPLQVDPKRVKGDSKAPCLVKSELIEISLTDVGSNRNSIKLYHEGKPLQLNDATDLVKLFFTDNKDTMLKLSDIATILKLSDAATADQIIEAIKKQDTTILQLTTERDNAKTALLSLQKTVGEKKVADLVDGAIAGKKITAAQRDHYIKLATSDYDTVKGIIDATPAYETLESQLGAGGKDQNSIRLNQLSAKTGDELWKSGELEELKNLSLPHFKAKYKEAFKKEFTEA